MQQVVTPTLTFEFEVHLHSTLVQHCLAGGKTLGHQP